MGADVSCLAAIIFAETKGAAKETDGKNNGRILAGRISLPFAFAFARHPGRFALKR